MITLTQSQRDQILTPATRRIMTALAEAGGDTRVVGGAVRDIMMNRACGDIDLATTLPPDRVIAILTRHSIKTAPTGIAYGTVTAVVDHIGYEITTLRRDVSTDGRRAAVAFTDDWRADAARRDFTFNALYADTNGAISDYFGGVTDAENGHVRFIGDAAARIREDVLRILRFFRFYAWFSCAEPNSDAVAACSALAPLIPRLSAQRIARETLKLLAARDPEPAWQLMTQCGVTQHFLAEASDTARLRVVLNNERRHHTTPDALLRLAALLPENTDAAAAVAARLQLSNRDAARLCALAGLPSLLRGHTAPVALRRLLYRHGAEQCGAALLLLNDNLDDALATIDSWENPAFPLTGEDIVASGIPAGARVGESLRAIEQWWIDGDFRANRDACLAHIRALKS